MQPRYSQGTAEVQPRYAPRRGPTGSWRRRAPERFHASSEKLPSKFREGCRSEHHHILALAVLGAAAAHAVHLDAQRANGCREEQRSCVLPASDSGDLNHPRDLPRYAEMCRDVPGCAEVCRGVPTCAEMCRGVPRCAEVCRGLPRCAEVCRAQRLHEQLRLDAARRLVLAWRTCLGHVVDVPRTRPGGAPPCSPVEPRCEASESTSSMKMVDGA